MSTNPTPPPATELANHLTLHETHHLFNANTDRDLGPATVEQVEASNQYDYGEQCGMFWIDEDGRPCFKSGKPKICCVYTWLD